ncbi:MAG: hypothetical protein P1U56_08495 [Saprospiraceae bacterium]|nr:hypothetical protein [Saprospiraceae bacterium]
MRTIIFLLLLTSSFATAQEQITFFESQNNPPFHRSYYFIPDEGTSYLIQEKEDRFDFFTINGETFTPISSIQLSETIDNSLCEDPRDCTSGEYFIELYQDQITIHSYKTGNLLQTADLESRDITRILDFSISSGKIYLSTRSSDNQTHFNIYDIESNQFFEVNNSAYTFIGHNQEHAFFTDVARTKVYYYNEQTDSFEIQYESETPFLATQIWKTGTGQSVVVSSEEHPFLIFQTPNTFEKFDCTDLDFETFGDFIYINKNLVYFERTMYASDNYLVFYDLENCNESERKYVGALAAEFVKAPSIGHNFVFFKSDQVSPDDLGPGGIIDVENNQIKYIVQNNIYEFYPKYSILNGDKIILVSKSRYVNYNYTWNRLVEVDLSSLSYALYNFADQIEGDPLSQPFGTIPYGTDVYSFNGLTFSEYRGYNLYNFDYQNEALVRTKLGNPFAMKSGLSAIGKYAAFEDKLVFTHENKIEIYHGSNNILSKPYTKTTDLLVHNNSLTLGQSNSASSEYNIIRLDTGSDNVTSTPVEYNYLWPDIKIGENAYFPKIFNNEIPYYLNLTTNTIRYIRHENSAFDGDVKLTHGPKALLKGIAGLEKGFFLLDTYDNSSHYLGEPFKSYANRFLPTNDNGFVVHVRGTQVTSDYKSKFYKMDASGKESFKLGEFNLGTASNQKVYNNEVHGFLLEIPYGGGNSYFISAKDKEVKEFVITTYGQSYIYQLYDKTLITDDSSFGKSTYVYNYVDDPVKLEGIQGDFLSGKTLGSKTILFFQEDDEIAAYELTNSNTLTFLSSHENQIDESIDNQGFIAILDEANLVLPLTTSNYGNELFTFNTRSNSFKLLSDINKEGDGLPRQFTSNGNSLFFTAFVENNVRQWFRLQLTPPLNIKEWESNTTEITPTLVGNTTFFSLDLDTYSLFNSSGQLVRKGSFYSAFEYIDLTGLASGLYFLKGEKEDQMYSAKLYKH